MTGMLFPIWKMTGFINKKCFINGEYWNTWYFDYPSWLADSYNNKCAAIESTFTPGWKSGRALY